ncbi:hypothetical protein ACWNT8_14665 [Pigmentibacter ruber]|nr:hypothetical protein GTC16762_10610 [Pigmentibacter ruber]
MERATPTYDISNINFSVSNKIGDGRLGAAVYNFRPNQVVKVLINKDYKINMVTYMK